MKFILICATGRSGSTTLQRIINTIEDSNISGEKWGAIENLLECYKNIKKTNHNTPKYEPKTTKFIECDELEKKKIKPAWYNSYNYEKVKSNIKNTIISILHNNEQNLPRVLGYKEIRWYKKMHLVDEFVELFPNTKIICHIDDNLDRQSKSSWFTTDPNAKNFLEEFNQEIINYSVKSKSNCYLSYMKNLFDIEKVREMFEFLGEKFDEKKYDYIIKNNLK